MFQVVENGTRFDVREKGVVHETLPAAIYSIEYDDNRGIFYLIKKDNKFNLPPKLYGDHSIVDRWIKSFKHNTGKNLGILLSGLKGTGKTITAEKFCNDLGRPVIIFSKAWSGSKFLDFITNPMFYNSVLFIDEFEKIYNTNNNEGAQDFILSLMDGIYNTKFVFLLTVNKNKISEFLINRLGRIKYCKTYDSLPQDVIDEVVNDLLEDKSFAQSITTFQNEYNICTFDILVNLIKEMNFFKEDAMECVKHLMLVPELATWGVNQIINDEPFYCGTIREATIGRSEMLSFRRTTEILKALRKLNDEIDIHNNKIYSEENESDEKTKNHYDTNIQLNIRAHEMTIEAETHDSAQITYTQYGDSDYPPQFFTFRKMAYSVFSAY